MVHLHFFGFGDPLCRFSLEQRTGLFVAGFRPLVLDELLAWSQWVARHQHWEIEPLQQMVVHRWMEQDDQIRDGNGNSPITLWRSSSSPDSAVMATGRATGTRCCGLADQQHPAQTHQQRHAEVVHPCRTDLLQGCGHGADAQGNAPADGVATGQHQSDQHQR